MQRHYLLPPRLVDSCSVGLCLCWVSVGGLLVDSSIDSHAMLRAFLVEFDPYSRVVKTSQTHCGGSEEKKQSGNVVRSCVL